MYPELFEFDQNESKSIIDVFLRQLMIYEITDEIINKPAYREYLLNTSWTYQRTINFIADALQIYETKEEYEKCAVLLKLKKEILHKTTETLAKNNF